MNDDHVVSVAQLKEFVKIHTKATFKSTSTKKETYEWVNNTLNKFTYRSLKKKEKGIVKKYLMNMTGYSEGAIDKLIAQKKKYGRIFVKKRTQYSFQTYYDVSDITLLAEVSEVTLNQNGRALKEMCRSMYLDFEDEKFEKLSHISVSHLYNLKKTRVFQSKFVHYTKTNPVQRNIGERKKPQPHGKPGYIRVDSVHQGDLDKQKGVYHINLVDEVTQMEYIGCVEKISEHFLIPVLEELLNCFPSVILGFHSDNGSEYINKQVAQMLTKMLAQQTKSRSRHTNDNALVEGKNGALIRKYAGYAHIPQKHAERINKFYTEYLNPYINFHRYCGFATEYINDKGKIKKKYETYMTPIQKLLSLTDCNVYLKEGISIESLKSEERRMTHFESAKEVFKERQNMFREINRRA